MVFAIAFWLMQAHAFQWTEIAKRTGDIQGQQEIDSGFEIQSRNWFGRSPPQTYHGQIAQFTIFLELR